MNATFTVTGPPEISLPNQSYCVETRETLNVTGLVTSFPPPASVHLLNATSGEVITNERFNISVVDTMLTIMVKKVQVSDGGNYIIKVSNSQGNDMKDFQIETKGPDPPQVTVQSVLISGYNMAVSVTCSVQATANASAARLTMVWTDPQVHCMRDLVLADLQQSFSYHSDIATSSTLMSFLPPPPPHLPGSRSQLILRQY